VVQFAGVNVEAIGERLKLLHELVPAAKSMAFLVNPTNSTATAAEASELQVVARVIGLDRAAIWSEVMRSLANSRAPLRPIMQLGDAQLAVYSAHASPTSCRGTSSHSRSGGCGLLLPSRLI
jgi:hypothetical protein